MTIVKPSRNSRLDRKSRIELKSKSNAKRIDDVFSDTQFPGFTIEKTKMKKIKEDSFESEMDEEEEEEEEEESQAPKYFNTFHLTIVFILFIEKI